jgi:hypothetical protein
LIEARAVLIPAVASHATGRGEETLFAQVQTDEYWQFYDEAVFPGGVVLAERLVSHVV